jgi:hypothetical protein
MKNVLFIFLFVGLCEAQTTSPFYSAPVAITYSINYSPAVNGGGFEPGLSSWTLIQNGSSTSTSDATTYTDGTHSCKLVIDGSNSAAGVYQVFAGMTGHTVYWSLKAKGTAGGGLRVSSDENSGHQSEFGVTADYQTYSGSFVAGDDYFEILRDGIDTGDTFYFDSVTMYYL